MTPPDRERRILRRVYGLVPLCAAGALVAVAPVAPLLGQGIDPQLTESIEWYTGVGGQVDNARAKDLLLAAVQDGDPISRMWLARVYSRGRMNFDNDPERAQSIASEVINRIESLANESVAEAVFLMGTAYDEGLGKEADIATGIEWYRRAAALDHGLAQHNLGNVYFEGRGVPQSDSLAVVWWTPSAERGDAIPQLRLGTMYETGRGVPRDIERAKAWYRRSAERGNVEAREALDRLENRS